MTKHYSGVSKEDSTHAFFDPASQSSLSPLPSRDGKMSPVNKIVPSARCLHGHRDQTIALPLNNASNRLAGQLDPSNRVPRRTPMPWTWIGCRLEDRDPEGKSSVSTVTRSVTWPRTAGPQKSSEKYASSKKTTPHPSRHIPVTSNSCDK